MTSINCWGIECNDLLVSHNPVCGVVAWDGQVPIFLRKPSALLFIYSSSSCTWLVLHQHFDLLEVPLDFYPQKTLINSHVREKKDNSKGNQSVVKTSNLGSGLDNSGTPIVKKQPTSKIPRAGLHIDAHLKESEDMLSNCLSNKLLRRWCVFEWFYSAIDYPWFARTEFVEYLKHVGLGHVPRLIRVEWGVIRSSLGRTRRFSEQFLKEEKENLSQYRDSVRKYYIELREGTKEGLPIDLSRPLFVGQRVMAIHPKTREIYDGNVLIVDHNQCKIQFDQPELGIEFVQDIDCMPLNPLENMPVSLTRKAANMNEIYTSFNKVKMSGRAKDQNREGRKKISSGEILKHVDVSTNLSPTCHLSNLMDAVKGTRNDSSLQAKIGINEPGNGQKIIYSALLAQMQAKEDDIQYLAELARALEKKEALVLELQCINDIVENQRDGDNFLIDSKYRKKQYAAVLGQLDAVNDQVSSAVRNLKQCNIHHSFLHRGSRPQQL